MFCPQAKLHCLLNDHSFSLRISVLSFPTSLGVSVCLCGCACVLFEDVFLHVFICFFCSRLLSNTNLYVHICFPVKTLTSPLCLFSLCLSSQHPFCCKPRIIILYHSHFSSLCSLLVWKKCKPSATMFWWFHLLLFFFLLEVLYPYMLLPPLQPHCECVVLIQACMCVWIIYLQHWSSGSAWHRFLQFLHFTINDWLISYD